MSTPPEPDRCPDCGRVHEQVDESLEAGLVRLALRGEDGFALGTAGIDEALDPLRAVCGRLGPDAPFAEGWDVLEHTADPRLRELREVWRPRALRLLGRAGELGPEQVLELRLEDRLRALETEIRRATAAGDAEAAEMAHARYIELGTTYVRRVVAS
jgi:hypothetical protein